MGTQVVIGEKSYEVESFSLREDSTPTASDDSSGSVGTIDFTVKGVEDPIMLGGKSVEVRDSRKGATLGTVLQVQETDRGTSVLSCESRLGKLNIYGVQAQPFVGTLGKAFEYYAELAGQETGVLVDDRIANRPVVFPGWAGELWFNLKQMAAAQSCEIALVSNVILLRPLRDREVVEQYDVSRNRSFGGTNLARSVEVIAYQNEPISAELVYPPGGWQPEVEVLSVNAGETVERDLELSASVSEIFEPVMQTFVEQDYRSSSVYTIVGDDGLPVEPAQWSDYGGLLTVSINEDTTSLKVVMRGATGIINASGEPISTYSVALGSDTTGNRYSTLRIVGSGVSFDKETLNIRTAIPDELTGTEVGITIDNPFLSTIDDAYTAGVRAAKWYSGEMFTIGGDLVNVKQVASSGVVGFVSYDDVQGYNALKTYDDVQAENSGESYTEVKEKYLERSEEEEGFETQLFGNVGGIRVWDQKSNRWYRTREATVNPGTISISAEDDLTYGDLDDTYFGITYGMEGNMFTSHTYSERDRRGLYFKDYRDAPRDAFPGDHLFPSTETFPQGG